MFTAPLSEQLKVAIPFLALATAIFSFMSSSFKDNIIETNFNRLKTIVEDNEKPLLKSLIKMKAKNRETELIKIYNLDESRSMFSETKLLERVYE